MKKKLIRPNGTMQMMPGRKLVAKSTTVNRIC